MVKYCNEHVCACVSVSVCAYLSASISPEPHARSLANFLSMLPMKKLPSGIWRPYAAA